MNIKILFFLLCCSFASSAYCEWYKGATHVHSLWSDGNMSPEMIALWYKEKGYNFVCFSEHNILQVDKAKLIPIQENSKLTPALVNDIRNQFGNNWVSVVSNPPRMRLKTHQELSERLNVPGKFLFVPAEEITGEGKGPHLTALNIRNVIAPVPHAVPRAIQRYLDLVDQQSSKLGVPMVAHLNHPHYQDGITVEELLATRGLRGIEIYSGIRTSFPWGNAEKNLPSLERYWDIILSLRSKTEPGVPLFGYASDDSHDFFEFEKSRANPGRGWIMVRSDHLDSKSLMEAMLNGDFYSSTGVTIRDVEITQKQMKVEIEREEGVWYRVQFIGTKKGFDEQSQPVLDANGKELRKTRIYSPEIGQVLFETWENPAIYEFTGKEIYVRATIISSKTQHNPLYPNDQQRAWVQPVMLIPKPQ